MSAVQRVLQQIRQARRTRRCEASISRFAEYRQAYEETLTTVEDLANEDAVRSVGRWAIKEAEAHGSLPDPNTFRMNARRILVERGVDPDAKASTIER